jgi:hypothetical protein
VSALDGGGPILQDAGQGFRAVRVTTITVGYRRLVCRTGPQVELMPETLAMLTDGGRIVRHTASVAGTMPSCGVGYGTSWRERQAQSAFC